MIININKQSILDSKPIKSNINISESFELAVNGTEIDKIKFINDFKSVDKSIMIENLSYLYKLNSSSSTSLLEMLIDTLDISDNVLECLQCDILNYIKSFKDNNNLYSVLDCIDKKIEFNKNTEYIKDNILFGLNSDRICRCCESTSLTYLSDKLDVIMYNINENPEVISDFELIVREIKTDLDGDYISSYPNLLNSSTNLIKHITVKLTGDVLDLMTSIPEVICEKIIDFELKKVQVKSFIKIYEKQISDMYRILKNGQSERFSLFSVYLNKLIESKEKLVKFMNKKSSLKEHVAEMQPEVGAQNVEVVKNVENSIDDALEDFTIDLEEAVTELLFNERNDDDYLIQTLYEFADLQERYNDIAKNIIVTEDRNGHRIAKRSQTISKVSQRAGTKTQQAVNNVKRGATAINKSVQPFFNVINKTINDIKKKNKHDRTEAIITGQYKFKLTRMVRSGIVTIATASAGQSIIKIGVKGLWYGLKGAAALTNPILTIIGIRAGIAIDKKIDKKYRQSILNDLESELKIVNEKIDDAKSNSDNTKKYQLMRIKNKLEKDIENIKYNLK